jgi:polyphosphate kinase 2 (PPK2 family)
MGAPKIEEFISRFRVTDGARFRLKDHDPASKGGIPFGKDEAGALLAAGVKRLAELQELLYAQDKWALLLIFQAMDAAGKDSAIKHVMSGVNPTGCHVTSFKQPNSEELDHDYLWRSNRALPQRGMIGIHNRSYYEEVLVVRVHPEYLKGQKLPAKLVGKDIWERRYEDIRSYERYLSITGSSFASSSSTSRARSRSCASWSASSTRRRTGSSRRATSPSGSTGRNTWRPTRRRSARPPPSTLPGT